jgi:hypothetical protein
MGYKRIYLGIGMTILTLFATLTLIGLQITSDGNKICAGTIDEPCMSFITITNPTAIDVYVYNANEVSLAFSPEIKEYFFFTEDKRCSATGDCACVSKLDSRKVGFKGWRCTDFIKPATSNVKYVFKWGRYSVKKHLLVGYKINPKDTVKWSIGTEKDYLDPVWGASVTVDMDGNASRVYEFGSVANISAGYTGGGTVCIDLDAPNYGTHYSCGTSQTSFFFNITTLRNDKWNKSNGLNANFSNGEEVLIKSDNRTDIQSIKFNATPNCSISNFDITGNNWTKGYKGIYNGFYLKDTEFYYAGNRYNSTNISFSTAGSKNVYFNITGKPKNITFQLDGFDADIGNDLDHYNYYNDTTYNSTQMNTSMRGYYDNFELNTTTAIWTVSTPGSMYWVDATDGYFYWSLAGTGGYSLDNSNDASFDLRNFTYVNADVYSYVYVSGGGSGAMSSRNQYHISDGTNNVMMYEHYVYATSAESSTETVNITYTSYKVYRNNVYQATKDLSTLDSTKQWYLKWYISLNDKGATATSQAKIYSVKSSGLRLGQEETVSGYAAKNGTFISGIIGNTTISNNYTNIQIYSKEYKPANTSISYEINSNNETWQKVTNFVNVQKYSLSPRGNILKYRINFTGTNISSPLRLFQNL